MSADADATQWFAERQPIPTGSTVVVATTGTLILQAQAPPKNRSHKGRAIFTTSCLVNGSEAFSNSLENGLGETRAISFSCAAAPCGAVVVTPNLPWTSTLAAPSWPLVDEWTAKLALNCGNTGFGTFSGTLLPTIGDKDEQGTLEGKPKDDADNALNFFRNRSGVLTEPQGGDILSFADSAGGAEGGNEYKLGSVGHDIITGECEPQKALCGPGNF